MAGWLVGLPFQPCLFFFWVGGSHTINNNNPDSNAKQVREGPGWEAAPHARIPGHGVQAPRAARAPVRVAFSSFVLFWLIHVFCVWVSIFMIENTNKHTCPRRCVCFVHECRCIISHSLNPSCARISIYPHTHMHTQVEARAGPAGGFQVPFAWRRGGGGGGCGIIITIILGGKRFGF